MILFPNAIISISRRMVRVDNTSGPTVIASNIAARIWSGQPALMKELYGQTAVYNLCVDVETDLRDGDTITGYNPQGLIPAPSYIANRVITRDLGLTHRKAHMVGVTKAASS